MASENETLKAKQCALFFLVQTTYTPILISLVSQKNYFQVGVIVQ